MLVDLDVSTACLYADAAGAFSAAGAFFFAGVCMVLGLRFPYISAGVNLFASLPRRSFFELLPPVMPAGLALSSCGDVAAAQKSKFPFVPVRGSSANQASDQVVGWATRIRTWTNCVKGSLPTVSRSPSIVRRFPGHLLCEHRSPILAAWQGLGQESPRSAGLDTMLSGAGGCLRLIESKQRRA